MPFEIEIFVIPTYVGVFVILLQRTKAGFKNKSLISSPPSFKFLYQDVPWMSCMDFY